MNPKSYEFSLLALCIWREARGEHLITTRQAVAWSIRNRVTRPGWWGQGWVGIILHPFQYSSFNHNDPNATKFPLADDPVWAECLQAANQVYTEDLSQEPMLPDPTRGADSYFDCSMDTNPPSWATDGSKVKTCDYGRLHFYRTL